ncbi:MAG: CDP-glucose 4,6-dehydratase [Planctomycetaceae bacterium TMED240]|nr:MAG: CDP-glucose 4,6-dehydratase [Planctomycetaceae bacterium TMED240]
MILQYNPYHAFRDKHVLVTGENGFKGSWLCLLLMQLGAKVYGLSLEENTGNLVYASCQVGDEIEYRRFDINDYSKLEDYIQAIQPSYIFHLAGQALTLQAIQRPLETFRTNALGTASILEASRVLGDSCSTVIITSDKCYRNNEWPWGYREVDVLAGKDPYSASKSAAEVVFQSYHTTYGVSGELQTASCRAGNVIGGGDWNRDRLIPDCIRSWNNNERVVLRNPQAVRPWNDVLDVLMGYILVAIHLHHKDPKVLGESFNFGPHQSGEWAVYDMVQSFANHWGLTPKDVISTMEENPHFEHQILRLSSEKSRHVLHWDSKVNPEDMLQKAAAWHKAYDHKKDMLSFSNEEVKAYLALWDLP